MSVAGPGREGPDGPSPGDGGRLYFTMGRRRIHQNDAERQAACRRRKAEERERLIAERDAAVARAEQAERVIKRESRYEGVDRSGSSRG
jgi:hypothetical protein